MRESAPAQCFQVGHEGELAAEKRHERASMSSDI